MNKKIILLVISMLLVICMLITGCSNGKTETESAASEGADNTNTVQSDISDAEEAEFASGDWKVAYAEVLKANEEGIRGYIDQEDINHNELLNNVLIYDLNGDGSPELLFVSGGGGFSELHVYTMTDGKAVECSYDVINDYSPADDNSAVMRFVAAGGGMSYMIYSGKEKGAFYIAHNIWSTTLTDRSIKYIMDNDGNIRLDTVVYNVSNMDPNEEYWDKYEINGKEVSQDEAVKVLKEHREDFRDLLMYNMKYGSLDKVKDFKVFSHVETEKPLAGSYDEVMEELSE